jgi:hypothetical protein
MRDIASVFVLVTSILSSGVVVAADNSGLTVVPTLDFGFKQSSMNFSANGSSYISAYKPSYVTLIPSLTMAYGQFYGAVSYDTPLTEYHTSSSTAGPSASTPTGIAYSDNIYSRQETTFTLGYRVLPALNVFAGHIKGVTRMRNIDYQYSGGNLYPYPGDDTFNTQGYFAGVSTSHNFAEKGTLALSFAYASMDGILESKYANVTGSVKSQDASGYSTSLSWTGPLGDSFFYRVGFRYAIYTYKFQTQASMKIQEPVQGLTFGVSKYF